MNVQNPKIGPGEKGAARCPGAPSTQEILSHDKVQAPPSITAEHYKFLGDEDIAYDRYITPEFAKLEYERMWNRTWQWACREEHIPNVGDYIVYDIGAQSFIITRTAANQVKAFYNACLHRGTKLRGSGSEGNATDFKCPFHGWQYNLDGSLKYLPCQWDFPHVDTAKTRLPEAKVELWQGFVWINMDEKAPPLAEYIGPEVSAHFAKWKLEERYVAMHVIKHMPCNWKFAAEAFLESYHVIETHPLVALSTGDANSQYDVWGDHVSRFLAPMGVLSPHLYGKHTEQDVLDTFTLGDRTVLGDDKLTVPEGGTARGVMADVLRDVMTKALKSDLSSYSDSEMLDCYSYNIFPNCFLFPGISLPMVYRFRPNPKDPTQCIYELLFLRPIPAGEARPAPAEPFTLTLGQSYSEVPGIDPGFGGVFDQDTDNLGLQQEGAAASKKRGLTLGNYQEIRIRQFERTIDKYVGKP
ncbi:MAG: aromatic ring-hydroxylating dioxygenase subunit alpha [Rhodospirillaceae bacterium]|nr:MAG: aromatic ring-hydroxylating dioxygenase subunit alpha [Rhodospirillaceae bacterium]